jgi:hypothetical protein
MNQSEHTVAALNLVGKWRVLFTGWQLGTRPKGDPEGDAVRDHREISILLRVESSALIRVLLEKGLITHDEWLVAMEAEALELDRLFQRRFPGVRASDDGLIFDKRALPWMKGWKP